MYGKASQNVHASWLWDDLEANAEDPLSAGIFNRDHTPYPPYVRRQLWEEMERRMRTAFPKQEDEKQPEQEATAPVELRAPEMVVVARSKTSPRKRKRRDEPPAEPELREVHAAEPGPPIWREFERPFRGDPDPPAGSENNTLLYVGGAALLALLVMAR